MSSVVCEGGMSEVRLPCRAAFCLPTVRLRFESVQLPHTFPAFSASFSNCVLWLLCSLSLDRSPWCERCSLFLSMFFLYKYLTAVLFFSNLASVFRITSGLSYYYPRKELAYSDHTFGCHRSDSTSRRGVFIYIQLLMKRFDSYVVGSFLIPLHMQHLVYRYQAEAP